MSKIPQTDSVAELSRFWDAHEITEFEDELEVVEHKVFDREGQSFVRVPLRPEEAAALHRVAQSKGVEDTELVKEWVSEKLRAS
jgi:hypothetical protein